MSQEGSAHQSPTLQAPYLRLQPPELWKGASVIQAPLSVAFCPGSLGSLRQGATPVIQ